MDNSVDCDVLKYYQPDPGILMNVKLLADNKTIDVISLEKVN